MSNDKIKIFDFARPADCIVGIALPCDIRTLRRQLADGNRHEYAAVSLREISLSRFDQIRYFKRTFLRALEMYADNFAKLGVKVIKNFSSNHLKELSPDRNSIFVLFAHWGRDIIELSDGFLEIRKFIDFVPTEFSGTFDLCVCHPKGLARGLAHDRPHIRATRHIDGKADPLLWLSFYQVLFVLLFQTDDLTYQMAFSTAVAKFNASLGLNHVTFTSNPPKMEDTNESECSHQ